MSLNMTIKEFEELNLFSNKNIEKVISSIVNESSNAALVAVFEDSVILLDHDNGQFYTADYDFNSKDLTVVLENFSPIELEKEESNFKEAAGMFFESEEASIEDLTEAYKESVIGQEKFVNDVISEALSLKDFEDVIDYKELAEANDKDSELRNESFFKEYQERLETNPLTESKYFNWYDKVVVSLLETERFSLVNSSAAEKASDLWKTPSFKEKFNEVATVCLEDVEAGKEKLIGLLEEYPSIFLLDKADRKILLGKAVIADKELRENMKELQEGLAIMFEDEDIQELGIEYISESEEEEKEEETDDSDEKEEKPAKELTPEQITKIADELKKVAEKVEDENLKEKLDKIISKLDESINEGTRPELIKEAVQLLSL